MGVYNCVSLYCRTMMVASRSISE